MSTKEDYISSQSGAPVSDEDMCPVLRRYYDSLLKEDLSDGSTWKPADLTEPCHCEKPHGQAHAHLPNEDGQAHAEDVYTPDPFPGQTMNNYMGRNQVTYFRWDGTPYESWK